MMRLTGLQCKPVKRKGKQTQNKFYLNGKEKNIGERQYEKFLASGYMRLRYFQLSKHFRIWRSFAIFVENFNAPFAIRGYVYLQFRKNDFFFGEFFKENLIQ